MHKAISIVSRILVCTMVTRSEDKMVQILSLLKEIPKYKNEKPDE